MGLCLYIYCHFVIHSFIAAGNAEQIVLSLCGASHSQSTDGCQFLRTHCEEQDPALLYQANKGSP